MSILFALKFQYSAMPMFVGRLINSWIQINNSQSKDPREQKSTVLSSFFGRI